MAHTHIRLYVSYVNLSAYLSMYSLDLRNVGQCTIFFQFRDRISLPQSHSHTAHTRDRYTRLYTRVVASVYIYIDTVEREITFISIRRAAVSASLVKPSALRTTPHTVHTQWHSDTPYIHYQYNRVLRSVVHGAVRGFLFAVLDCFAPRTARAGPSPHSLRLTLPRLLQWSGN